MRRQWTRTGLYLAGLLTLPGLCGVGWVVGGRAIGQTRTLPDPTGTVVFDEPATMPVDEATLVLPLRIRAGMLASETPDAAEAEKTAQLREQLRQAIDEKAALLNSDTLAEELQMHQRHIAELKALKELQRLEQSLKELSDKYPDSLSARRARDVLEFLKQRRLVPRPDDGFGKPAPPYVPYEVPNERAPQLVPQPTPDDFARPFRNQGNPNVEQIPPKRAQPLKPTPGNPEDDKPFGPPSP